MDSRVHRVLFPIGIFLSASLLFIIQPIAAKLLLPVYGGTPAVWTVCMLFFQTVLLMAYAYSWFLSQLSLTHWRIIHIILTLLSVCFLPIEILPTGDYTNPIGSILKTLTISIGLPVFMIAACAPLLQFAYAHLKTSASKDPYYLYAASNAGSLCALICYPWIFERVTTIGQQLFYWSKIYFFYLIVLSVLMYFFSYEEKTQNIQKINYGAKVIFTWIILSFIPCSLMLGVTFYITTDLAATPVFWIFPLILYLLSFIITFSKNPLVSQAWVERNLVIFMVFPILSFILGVHQIAAWQTLLIHLTSFFVVALFCHGRLAQIRPSVEGLTTFYVCLALGGALAGIFNGLLAPVLFVHPFEYPLVFLLVFLFIPYRNTPLNTTLIISVFGILTLNAILNTFEGWRYYSPYMQIFVLILAVILAKSRKTLLLCVAILFIFIFLPDLYKKNIIQQSRNFFGIKQVVDMNGNHVLISNSTIHGFQIFNSENELAGNRAYYGPVGEIVNKLKQSNPSLHATILGLGTGMMACQFRKDDFINIMEIDRQVIEIAQNKRLFTYTSRCPAIANLNINDGRLGMKTLPNASMDLIVLDAFSSDSIPIHLVTVEAFELYKKKLKLGGVILANVSNRHLRVWPVIAGAGYKLDMAVLHKVDTGHQSLGQLASEWVLLTEDKLLIGYLMANHGWNFVSPFNQTYWTDEYSNPLALLKW